MITVGINAHLLSGEAGFRRAGIHHYIAQVLRHLPARPGWRFTVFTRAREEAPRGPHWRLASSRWPTERRLWRIAWEQLVWPWAARRRRLDLLHGMAFATPLLAPCPTMVTVYDLSFLHFPERYPPWQRRYLTWQTRRSCRAARRVVAISESGRQDIHRLLGVSLERIDVVAPGVDPAFRPLPAGDVAAFRAARGLPPRFLLHVGTLQPRKNLPALIAAFGQLLNGEPDSGDALQLVLVGGKGWLYDEIFGQVARLGLDGRVRHAGYVPDADLPLWYNAATALVFPSVYEGFGMPVAQALACGTPVVAARSSAIPEVVGEAALCFDPHDVPALVAQLQRLLAEPELAAELRRRGPAQASGFTWEKAGAGQLAAYERALATP